MNRVVISFLTKDRVELTKQSIEPLLQPGKFDLFWIDGSTTGEGRKELERHQLFTHDKVFTNVRGGAGAALVFALTEMLKGDYDYVGLVENDVLLPPDWFDRTLDLFRIGNDDGLCVGAVSARCYENRILFQRTGYAVCHNLGAGMVVFDRRTARLVLDHFRSGWTTDNRRIFCQLSGVDIGPFWAFRNSDHPLVADWHWDAMLAAHGFASLALTPSPVEMIGQVPPLAEQGLTIAKDSIKDRTDKIGFETYATRLALVRDGLLEIPVETRFQQLSDLNTGITSWVYLPHQLHMLGGSYSGDWRQRELRGFGEFGWVSGNLEESYAGHGNVTETEPSFRFPLYGATSLLLGGGKTGGRVEIVDEQSGFEASPFIQPEGEHQQLLQIPLPANISQRMVRVTMRDPGLCFYRIVAREKQPWRPDARFDYSILPAPV